MSVRANGASQPDTPEVCDMRCRTRTWSLPLAANSGQYAATGASRSTSPRSASISTARLVTVLVVDQTFTIVSGSHGRVRASSA